MKIITTSIFTFFLLFSGDCDAQWVRVDKDSIRLDGVIDRDSYQSYLDASMGGYSKVILSSVGGSPLPALMIAQDMWKRQPEITVEDYCLSACANYLIFATPAPEVPCGAALAWHGTISGDASERVEVMRLEGRNPKLIEAYRKWAERFHAMEVQYFRDVGIDRNILFDSTSIVDREDIVPEAKFTFDEMTGDTTESISAGMWVPTTAIMRGYGMDTRNFCQTYDADIPRTLESLGMKMPYTSAGPN